MGMPAGIGVIDTLIGLPHEFTPEDDPANLVGYMFKSLPRVPRTPTSTEDLLRVMDSYGIERGLQRGVEDLGMIAAQYMPANLRPPCPINDKRAYPVYAKCVELDIPIFVNGGVPGPRLPMDSQYPGLVDEVCYFFPDLRFVFRHGCDPWLDLTVKLLLKWPNLYYSTSGFAPKYYPKEIINYANTRGADKIIYAGYYPYGLDLERIFRELPNIGLKDHVWPKFLRDNAARVLKLDVGQRHTASSGATAGSQ
jgi:uncharacterized protein